MTTELFDIYGRPVQGRVLDSDHETGTTTDDYADALDWDARYLRDKSILLKNTDGANGLKYKLLVQMYYGGADHEEVAETTLAPGEEASFQYLKPYARMKLQVKAASAGSQATYQVDYIGYGV